MATPWKHPTTQVYYIRRAVPRELQPILGTLFKRSLGTKDLAVAKPRFTVALAESEERFAAARAQLAGESLITAKDAQQLASRWYQKELDQMESSGDFTPYLFAETEEGATSYVTLNAFFEGDLSGRAIERALAPFISAALAEANLPPVEPASVPYSHLKKAFGAHLAQLSDIAYARHKGDWLKQPGVIPEAPLSHEKEKLRKKTGKLVSELFADFSKDKLLNDGDNRTTRKTLNEYEGVITRFIEYVGDLPVVEITRQVVTDYRVALSLMPSKGEGIRLLSAREQIAKAEAEGLPRLSDVTIKNRLRVLSSVLGFAIPLGVIQENPVVSSGVTMRLAKAISKKGLSRRRRDYTREEMKTIFSSPIFSGVGWSMPRTDLGKALYWIPLLAAYTGARREELCQLFVSDIKRSPEGIPYISILEVDEEDEERTVKNSGSRRAVPIHDDLIQLGFLGYVEGLPTGGQLFPRLTKDAKGFYGKNYGKHWAKYLQKVVQLKTTATPSHGFRHAFKTLCREVRIPEDAHDALTGHSDGDRSVSRGYGQMPLGALAEELKKFPSIAREAGLLK